MASAPNPRRNVMTDTERTLALVSACFGFSGAVFLAHLWLAAIPAVWPTVLLIVSTTVVAATLGRMGARKVKTSLGFAAGTLLAGGVNGAVLGTVAGIMIGEVAGLALIPGGFLFGMFCALPFVPAMVVAFAACRRVERARRGSLLEAADRRAPWTSACVTILAVGWAFAAWQGFDASMVMVLGAAVSGSAALAVSTLRGWWRARAWRLAFAGAEPDDESASEAPGGVVEHDLGVGDAAQALRERGDAYRMGVRTTARLRGDATLTTRILRGDLALASLSLLLSLGVSAWLWASPLDHVSPFDAPERRARSALR